jgi:hypothetical protein
MALGQVCSDIRSLRIYIVDKLAHKKWGSKELFMARREGRTGFVSGRAFCSVTCDGWGHKALSTQAQ